MAMPSANTHSAHWNVSRNPAPKNAYKTIIGKQFQVHGGNHNICHPECTPGKFKCSDMNHIQFCDEDGFQQQEICEFGGNANTGKCYTEFTPGEK